MNKQLGFLPKSNNIAGYKIKFFHYPGGIQASNTAKEVRGDYEQLAFIRHRATDIKEIDWEKKGLPQNVKDYILEYFTDNVDAFKPDPPKVPKYTVEEVAAAMKDAWNYPEALNWAEKYGLVFRISASQVQWTEKGSDYYDFPEARQRRDAQELSEFSFASCPPMKDGKPDISPMGLKKLKLCIRNEESTKVKNTFAGEPRRYTETRKALHKQLIDEFKHQRPCVVSGKPIAVLTGGAPGSGKTHFLKGFAPWMNSDQVYHIDADAVRAKLPEYKGWNADNTHEETSDIVKEMLDSIGQPCKHDLVYDGTMNKAKKYLPLVRKLKEMGYEVLVIYMQVPKEVSVSRALERYQRTGRYVPIEVIDEVFDSGLEAYEQVIREADGYIRVDGMTGTILEKGGSPIPTERNYEDVSCGPHPCNGTAETSPSLRIKLAKAKAMAARARALALNK